MDEEDAYRYEIALRDKQIETLKQHCRLVSGERERLRKENAQLNRQVADLIRRAAETPVGDTNGQWAADVPPSR